MRLLDGKVLVHAADLGGGIVEARSQRVANDVDVAERFQQRGRSGNRCLAVGMRRHERRTVEHTDSQSSGVGAYFVDERTSESPLRTDEGDAVLLGGNRKAHNTAAKNGLASSSA